MDTPTDPIDSGETLRGLRAGEMVFGRYALIQQHGAGDFGEVWAARDRVLERDVALEFLPEAVARDRAAVAAIKREIRWALELTHPNIVRVHDFVAGDGLAAIAKEAVGGTPLSALRDARAALALGAEELLPLLAQLCEALEYAHTAGRIVHRHLAPVCLLVSPGGDLKVAGFERAVRLGDPAAIGRRGGVDAVAYQSPQQARGHAPAVTDDIHALGAVCYELLTGHLLAVPAGTPDDARQGRAPEPIPAQLAATIAACLAEDPAARPQSVGEVAAHLGLSRAFARRVAAAAAELAPGPVAERMAPPRARGRRRFVGIVAGVCALLAVAGYVGLRAGAERKEGNVPVHTPTAAVGPRAGERWEIADLGMRFVPVPGTPVLFSVWETRVQDFAAFVAAKGYDATVRMKSYRSGNWDLHGDTWQSPGFPQGPTHPVVGVNVGDAILFCTWLTARERAAGRLTALQRYRLPSDAEWTLAAGKDAFPWGAAWPPPPRAGNYADETGRDVPGAATAPVGSFASNRHGLHDLGGNAWELVGDRRGWMRGASFRERGREALATTYGSIFEDHSFEPYRYDNVGFRVVCDPGGTLPAP